MTLRRYRTEDAETMYQHMGTDPAMYEYSGWNPYETLEKSQETVLGMIRSYDDGHVYSWVMDVEDVIVGTIGAYDFQVDRIEVGFSVVKGWQGRGLATEALKKVLEYLTENEEIPCVAAWWVVLTRATSHWASRSQGTTLATASASCSSWKATMSLGLCATRWTRASRCATLSTCTA